MRELQAQNELLARLLGKQETEEGLLYRPLSFCVLAETEEGTAAYNSLTGEVLLLTPEEAEALKRPIALPDPAAKKLIEKWFLVPLAHDDIGLCDEARTIAGDLQKNRGLNNYIIFTTTDCNARCFYCYEMGAPRQAMSAQTARDAADFILRTHGDDDVNLTWFGGEPLCNKEVIEIITSALREAEVRYTSRITSNGYLFDAETVQRAKDVWHLKKAQITIDGTEETYNKTKAYIYKNAESPFRIVTDNIERLMDLGIHVDIRMNLGEHNKQELYQLVDWLDRRYPDKKNLTAYAHPLYEYTEIGAQQRLHGSRVDRYEENRKLLDYCKQKGMFRGYRLPDKIKLNNCQIDSPSTVTIMTNGKLGKCEHFMDRESIGDIYSGITDPEKEAMLAKCGNSRALCTGCAFYPICRRPVMCDGNRFSICDTAVRLGMASRVRDGILRIFRAERKKAADVSAE